uniref:hypothetical protein n=1 Tax=Methylobacterium sp. B34 TaxID=95563 RepID=UPI0003478938|nr:hypothetical protein [Methylobacterium sp. B34]
MIKLSTINHLAAEVLHLAAAHGFTTAGLKKVTDLLLAHAVVDAHVVADHVANTVVEVATEKMDEATATAVETVNTTAKKVRAKKAS